jgi:hypothetical protein
VGAHHDHVRDAACLPACPAWAEGALRFLALQRRYPEMLEACRTAPVIEYLDVSPSTQGTILPEYLQDDVVRLNLVVGRDTPEILLDEWGLRCTLTFRGRRFDCAFPWPSILGGLLRAPARSRPRFGVIEGAEPAPRGGGAAEAARPAGPPRLGVIPGGKKD